MVVLIDPARTCEGIMQCLPDILEDWTMPTVLSLAGKTVRVMTCWMGPVAPAGDALGNLLETPAVGGIAHFVVSCAVMRKGVQMIKGSGLGIHLPRSNDGRLVGFPYLAVTGSRKLDSIKGVALLALSGYFGIYASGRSLHGLDWG